jgi:hypothetical protein
VVGGGNFVNPMCIQTRGYSISVLPNKCVIAIYRYGSGTLLLHFVVKGVGRISHALVFSCTNGHLATSKRPHIKAQIG